MSKTTKQTGSARLNIEYTCLVFTTDIINHRYLTSYWLTRNRLLPIVRHCAEAIEKLD